MTLAARNITVGVRGKRIVDDASLEIAPGSMVGLIGPNGAGKSTLLKALLGVGPRDTGTVTLDGQDFFKLASRERARQVAFLPQERRVEWRLPARDIVMLGRYPHQNGFGGPTPADIKAVDAAIAAVDGGALVDRPVAVLSGGERSRILLARALAVGAPYLLVDEPTNALDPFHQIHVMEILHEMSRRGCGVLAVIHDLAFAARFMDQLILMDEGAVVAKGPPAEVLTDERLAAVYGVTALRGEREQHTWLLPWARLPDRGADAGGNDLE